MFSVLFRMCKGRIYLENKYMRGEPAMGMNEDNTAHVADMVKECSC